MKASGLVAAIHNRLNRHQVYSNAEYWNAKAEEYEGTAVSGWPNQSLNTIYERRELEILDSCFPDVRGAHVLDIGCGTGRVSRHLAARGARVLGIDFSAKAIELARRESPSGNPTYLVRSIFDLREDAQFNIALSFGCMVVACTTPGGLSTVLAAVFRALKPGGMALLIEPIHRGPLHFVLNMNVREFQATMVDVGFTIQRVAGLHCWPIVRILGHVNFPRRVTCAGYHLGERVLAQTSGSGTFLTDYKVIVAARPHA